MSLVTVNTAALPFILQAENKNLLLFDIADLNIHGLCKTNGRVMFVVDSRAIVLVSRDDTHTFLFPACTATSLHAPTWIPTRTIHDLKAEVILKRKR